MNMTMVRGPIPKALCLWDEISQVLYRIWTILLYGDPLWLYFYYRLPTEYSKRPKKVFVLKEEAILSPKFSWIWVLMLGEQHNSNKEGVAQQVVPNEEEL